MEFFSQLKEKFASMGQKEDHDMPEVDEYVELDHTVAKESGSKILVRPFNLEDFEDIKEILDVLREGTTIALVNIRPLKDKDLVELKRAINKLKKTTDAVEGDIAGFGDDWIVVTPSFAKIHRNPAMAEVKEE